MAAYVGAIVAVIGAAAGAYSQHRQGEQAKKTARDNALAMRATAAENARIAAENLAIAQREASALENAGTLAVSTKRREIARLLAYQRTQEAISGFKHEGTPDLIASVSEAEGEQDVATIWSNALTHAEEVRAKGRVAAIQGEYVSDSMRRQADIEESSGEYASRAGKIGAASTLLSGFSSAYSTYKKIQ